MKQPPHIDLRRYEGQWIALDPKTHAVVSAKPSLKAAEDDAKQRGVAKPLLFPVPPADAFFVGLTTTSHTGR